MSSARSWQHRLDSVTGGPTSSMRFSIAGRLNVHYVGTDCPTGRWAARIARGMEPPTPGPDDITIEFRPGVRPQGRSLPPINLGPTMSGIWVADHLDRAAWIPFHDLFLEPVVVDSSMDPRFFSNWIFHPVVRAALWRKGVGMYRGAGAAVNDHRVGITAWAATGKSRILFELLRRGHEYIADDWMALSDDGFVSPIGSQVDFRDDQRAYVDSSRWPGRRSVIRPLMVKTAKWASGATGRRWGNLSTGLDKLADAAWKAGWQKTDLATLFPQAAVADAGPLDILVVLASPGVQIPSRADVPEVMAACAHGEYGFTEMEAAYRFSRPGKLTEPLYPRFETNRDFAAQALHGTRVVVVPFSGSFDDVEAVANMVEAMGAGLRVGRGSRGGNKEGVA